MDVLAALEALEEQEQPKGSKPKKKNPPGFKPTNTKFRNPLTNQSNQTSSSQRVGRTQTPRPKSLQISPKSTESDTRPQSSGSAFLSPNVNDDVGGSSVRSASVASSRRISFANPPRPEPTQRRLRIATRTESLASGFPYDPRLIKYDVDERVWEQFSKQLVDAAELPKGSSLLWSMRKKEVINKIKKDLQYDGDFKRFITAWNKRNFGVRGFKVSLELPGAPKYREEDTAEEREQTKKDAKKFRICITPNSERSASVYSRNSSMTRSITNEGTNLQQRAEKAASPPASERDESDKEDE